MSRTNPVLMAQPPFGLGVGPLFSQYQLLQFAPTAAYKLTDELSIGLAGNFDMGFLSGDPAFLSPPTVLNTPVGPLLNYPQNTHTRSRLGGGFSLGLYYVPDGTDWGFGASVKSPQWFEPYTYNYLTVDGKPGRSSISLNYPLVASLGTSYSGFDRWLFAGDVRFLNYHNTDGFRSAGFNPDGSVKGVGWQNVFTTAIGVQYLLSESVTLRAGYTFALNPAGNSLAHFNIASPTIVQHSLSLGASYNVTQTFMISAAYVHYFESSLEGPIYQPGGGPIAGTSVRTSATADSVVIGATVAF